MEGSYNAEEVEEKWQEKWQQKGTYEYSKSDEVYSIDTPPPTVSGSLHFGHTYGNTLTDFKARFERMNGKSVLFPFGYDNNGIASERLTEKELGIRHQDFERREFQEKVRKVCKDYEQNFEDIMKEFAFSMDWNNTYKTIEPRVQKISQLSFIDLYEKGREYREKAPAIWCPECSTAISQVETEDMEKHSHFNDIEFDLSTGNGSITISTTRPELLPACVAIFVHPEDEGNRPLIGEKAEVPLFDYEVPIIKDERVDMETGTGVVMCCTFGDQNDIEWYQKHDLDLREAIDETGTMTGLAEKYEGLSTHEAREEIVEDLDDDGKLTDRWEIDHTVQVHERCDAEIEFMVTEQWYVKVLDRKEEYLEAGKEMDWNPEKMFTRYKNWVEGLEWDWCISRQRDSGIPFPVWYCTECGLEVIADRDQLPVDPIEDDAPVDECSECGNTDFEAEEDVFDTWATSSLTPLINADWNGEELGRPELYPMNLRPQGHDIISFWLFHTVVKCYEHTGEVPFDEVLINGHVLDENREKMSKSRGNVTTPQEVLEDYSVDAARYWAGTVKPGDDLPLKDQDLVEGEKLLTKLWNASKLVNSLTEEESELEEEVDRWMMAKTDKVIEDVTEHFENHEFSKARDRVRSFFWNTFCDDYLEISKQRLEEDNESAETGLRKVHKKILKMLAPFTPHITEEIWNDMYRKDSIHRSDWPETEGLKIDLEKGDNAMKAISALRKFKSDNQMPLNSKIKSAEVSADISGFEVAIKEVMHVKKLEQREDSPDLETKIKEIKLNYANAGPEYGDKIGEIEDALENNEFMVEDGRLEVADERLKPEMFTVVEEKEYTGDGKLVDGDVPVVVKQ
jgi:valyl-tRNA synthetase